MLKKKISNNQAWINLFKGYSILEKVNCDGFMYITSDEIKAIDGKESRLMTKYDHRHNIPTILKENNLSLLAVKNGKYKIAKNDPFLDIKSEISSKIIELSPPIDFLTLDPYNINSESQALDIAVISGMIDIVFKEKKY